MGLSKFISCLIKNKVQLLYSRHFSEFPRKPPWKILFFGTDEFSLFTLKLLTQEYRKGTLLNKLEVVTTIKGKANPVKLYSEEQKLPLHKWPPKCVIGQFDVGLVVSFGHLIPRNIIEQFEFGMLNVHASLLPRWRGAAPVIYAIANGDRKTGITIMKISPDKFDVGDIINQESVEIHPNMKMRELYTTLGKLGANSLINTLETLPHSLCTAKPQPSDGVTYAPKVNASLACVKWDKMTSHQVYNLERALDGVFHLQTSWNGTPVKLMNINKHGSDSKKYDKVHPGFVDYDKQRKVLKILCSDFQFITVKKVGVLGKRVMTSGDFHNGYVKKEAPDCRYFQ